MVKTEIANRTFQWDENKARKNLHKHGISFEQAALVFEDENRTDDYDLKHSEEEDRWITVGMVNDIVTVVYTERGEDIRLISAWVADENDRRRYYEDKL